MKKMLLHVPLAAMLCLGIAAPAAAQGTIDTDRTPAAGSTMTNPNNNVPYRLGDPRMNNGAPAGNGFINGYGNGFGSGYGQGMTGNGMRGLNSNRNNMGIFNNDGDRMMERMDKGINDANRNVRRAVNNTTVRARAAANDTGNNWGWLGLLGLVGLAGMFRGGNPERDRT